MSIPVYIGYSTDDITHLEALKKHLKPLVFQGKISIYDYESVQLGHDLYEAVEKILNDAQIILLLLSANSLCIDSFYNFEIPLAIKQHRAGVATLFPIVVKNCLWKEVEFNFIQKEVKRFSSFWRIFKKNDFRLIEILPDETKSIEEWSTKDKAYSMIAEKINQHVVELIRQLRMQEKAERLLKQKGISITTYN